MVKIISAPKGFGKTKILLEKANKESETKNVIFVAFDSSLRFEVSSRARLIENCSEEISGFETLLGFLKGVSLSNYETEIIIVDNVLKYVNDATDEDLCSFISKLDKFSEKASIHFVLSISKEVETIPEELKNYLI